MRLRPLDQLATFMEYAEQTKALRKVFADLASALAESDNLKALTGRALDTSADYALVSWSMLSKQKYY